MAQIKATWASVLAMTGLSAPVLGLVVAVGAVVAIFYALYKNGWSMSTAWSALKDNLERFGMSISELIDTIRNKLPNDWGGISDDEKKLRDEERTKRRKELDEKEKERDKERAATAKERGYDTKEEQQKKAQLMFDNKKLGMTQAEVKTLEQKQAAEQGLNLKDPLAALKGLAKSEGSAFIKDAPGAAATPTPQAAQAAAQTPAQAAQNSGSTTAATTNPGSSTATTPGKATSQDPAASGLNTLNTNIEKMIAMQRQTNSLLSNSLRVQENMSGNLSNDVFGAVA
jgi:hypothetical protein